MDENAKNTLLERFGLYLDKIGDAAEPDPDDDQDHDQGHELAGQAEDTSNLADLYTLFVELAGLRTEVRTESRLVKDALDQFRIVLDQTAKDRALLEQQLDRARAEARQLARTLLRPLLLDLLDVRDRLDAALDAASKPQAARLRSWPFPRIIGRIFARKPPAAAPDAWLEGQKMTLRRLDRLLLDRGVVMLDLLGQVFHPQRAKAVATVVAPDKPDGLIVTVSRPGFLWNEDLLRPAEVVVTSSKS
jgi:molecular chaperone GrpE